MKGFAENGKGTILTHFEMGISCRDETRFLKEVSSNLVPNSDSKGHFARRNSRPSSRDFTFARFTMALHVS